MGKANIARGEKWFKTAEVDPSRHAWYETQPAIIADIEEYLASIVPVEEPTKSKEKK